jgi:hypothetical protein
VLGPDATIRIARAILDHAEDDYTRTLAAGRTAIELIREAAAGGKLALSKMETRWFERIQRAFDALPETAEELEAEVLPRYEGLVDLRSYGTRGWPSR